MILKEKIQPLIDFMQEKFHKIFLNIRNYHKKNKNFRLKSIIKKPEDLIEFIDFEYKNNDSDTRNKYFILLVIEIIALNSKDNMFDRRKTFEKLVLLFGERPNEKLLLQLKEVNSIIDYISLENKDFIKSLLLKLIKYYDYTLEEHK